MSKQIANGVAKGIEWEDRIGRRLRLRDLHVFFAVVQCGSMVKAAAELGVSQPVVSESIADLETTIGVPLFDRGPRGVVPTQFGDALLRRARAAFDELRQGIKEIEGLADPTVGEVRIGCPESVAAGVLSPIVDRMSLRFPRVRFHVTQVNTLNARLEFPELRERRVDLVLARAIETFGNVQYAPDLNIEKLLDDQLVVVAGTRSKWARRTITLGELADAPWILPANSWNSLRIEEAFSAIGMDMPDAIIDTFSLSLRRELLATGRFVAAIPATILRGEAQHEPISILPVELPDRPWPVAMITMKNRTSSRTVQHFVECARDVVKSINWHPRNRLVHQQQPNAS